MSFNPIHENKILAKISGSTVYMPNYQIINSNFTCIVKSITWRSCGQPDALLYQASG